MRTFLTPAFFLLSVSLAPVAADTPPPPTSSDTQLLNVMVPAGAFAEAFAEVCQKNNPRETERDAAQLAAWLKRNHWPAIQSRLDADANLQGEFTRRKQAFTAEFAAHRFKTAFACGLLPQQLASAAHDPSVKYRSELERLDNAAPTDSSPSQDLPAQPSPTAGGGWTKRPGAGNIPSQPSKSVVPTTGEAATAPPGNPLTTGPVTFTPPAGWQVKENTPQRTLLSAATDHTKAAVIIEPLPLNGDLRTAFSNALRTQTPVMEMKLKYPHEGVTSGGSPMIQILDYGPTRGGRQKARLDAVGVALGNTMLLAALVSGDWGGDNIGFERAFEKMVSHWKLAGEGGPAWDPMRPPTPQGARSAFYLGSRIQNQVNPMGGLDTLAIREYLVLLPTGQAFQELPDGGHVLDMDFAAECARKPNACGTYRITDNRIDFTWRGEYGMVTRESSPIDTEPGGKTRVASFNGTRAIEVSPVNNLRVTGRYTSTFASTGSTAFSSTSVVAQTFISFSPDGSYQKSGFSSGSFSGSGAAGTVSSRKGVQTGRYVLNGYLLTLNPSDGQPPEIFTTVLEEISSSPKVLFIDDKAFLRDGR